MIKRLSKVMVSLVAVLGLVLRAEAAVKVKDSGYIRDEKQLKKHHLVIHPEHKNHIGRYVELDSGIIKYTLYYVGCQDPSHGGKTIGRGLGLGPGANWYQLGFIDVIIDGQTLFEYLPEWEVLEEGEKGVIKITWDEEKAKIIMTFTLNNNDNKLLLNIKVKKKTSLNSIKTKLICYPSSFGKWLSTHRELEGKRDRWIMTPKRDIQHSNRRKKITLNKDEQWVIYYDKIWDVKKGLGGGPCALLYPPQEPKEVKIELTNYEIRTELSYSPDTQEMNYVLWDFRGKSNKDAIEYMKSLRLFNGNCAEE